MHDLRREIHRSVSSNLARLHNEAITQALCRALGLEDCNPYDFINRMSQQQQGGGRTAIFLDGKPLLAFLPFTTEWAHDELTWTFQTEYLWVEQATKSPD